MTRFNPPQLDQMLQQAIRHHQAGQLPQADALYRQILTLDPHQIDALQNLGILACQAGQPAVAVELLLRAIAIQPNNSLSFSNLSEAYNRCGHTDLALRAAEKALALDPSNRDSYVNLALYLNAAGRMNDALRICRDALRLDERQPLIHRSLGDAFLRLKNFEPALTAYQRALQLLPDLSDARFNLGMSCVGLGRLDQAESVFRACVQAAPRDADAHFQLAEVLALKGRIVEALSLYEAALQRGPQRADIAAGMANTLKNMARVDEALAAYQLSLHLDPSNSIVQANLANTLRDTGQHDAAITAFRQALSLDPARSAIRSALILTYYLHPEACTHTVQEEKARWNSLHALPLAAGIKPLANLPDPHRPLRIGYVSSDLRDHPVGHFMMPVLSHHDRTRFAVYCYFNHYGPDEVSAKLRSSAHAWHQAAHLSDDQLADLIRQDQIDILVDLNMHTIGNRLTVFAQRPAPVQISYLAYTDGPGLSCIDYRLTDPYLDPTPSEHSSSAPHSSENASGATPVEQPLSLPDSYWCYFAPDISPLPSPPAAVSESPVTAAGFITFGSLNYFSKVSRQAASAWARILSDVPNSHLTLHVPRGEPQARMSRFFLDHGIAAERLRFVPRVVPSEYYQLYNSIDLALDPFPYVGGTTTCDALFMGVPVVTLAGPSPTSRGGLSILSNLELPELIVNSIDQYVSAAVRLAGDLPRLAELRRGLRSRLQHSPLMDVARFTHNLEVAYRRAWQSWCARHS